ncbi:MAG: ABC transporter permease [Clostridia bacterium]|nr:ABC transporter permease [Clostridia bacterium]
MNKAKKICMAAFLALILAFIYVPILLLALYSFTDATMVGGGISSLSFSNYITLFANEDLRGMIGGTVLLAFGAALLSTILGTLGAIGAFYSKKTARHLINYSNQIPVVNADVVTGFSICVLLIVMLGVEKDTYVPLVIGHTVLCAPFVYLSVMPRLRQMDNNLYEAALDLGATPSQALVKVVIPQLLPGILSGFMLAITLSLDDYFITTYTKPSTFDTISTYVVNATKGSQTEIKTALWALSTLIFIIVVVVVILMNVLSRRKEKEAHDL